MTSKTGRCLCGQVTYAYDGPELWRAHCHCESCRRNTSSPFTTFFAVPKAAFRYTGRSPRSYDSSPGVRRSFCDRCGTPMAYENAALPDEVHLYAASLDDSRDFRPERHDFYAERVPWVTLADDLPRDDGEDSR